MADFSRVFMPDLLLSLDDEFLLNHIKGDIGEITVHHLLSYLNKDCYFCINNLLLPLKNGGTTQIDHVILSPYGIFVIETKNYQGFIFGSEYANEWTQKTYRGTYQFYNPIKQNNHHIKTLANLLSLEITYFHSMILFIGECEIKTTLPNYVIDCCLNTDKFFEYIDGKKEFMINQELFKKILQTISNHRIKNTIENQNKHQEYVKHLQNLCPKCQSTMVKRIAKNTGKKFLGCSRFPYCRGTRQFIDKETQNQQELSNLIKYLL